MASSSSRSGRLAAMSRARRCCRSCSMSLCTGRTCRARSRTRALPATATRHPLRPTTTTRAGSTSRAASRRRSPRNSRAADMRSSAGPTGSGSPARSAGSWSTRSVAPSKPAPTPAEPPTPWGGDARLGPPASGRHAGGTPGGPKSLRAAAADVFVGRAVAMRVGGGLAAGRRDHVDAGVIADRALLARADLEQLRVLIGAILQTVAVPFIGRKPGRVAGMQHLFAVIGDEHNLAREHIDELVLAGVPMALARPGAGRQPQEVDTELRQPGRVAEPGALAGTAGLVIGRRVERADGGFQCRGVDAFCHCGAPFA